MTATERLDPPLAADEATMVRAYLDYHRDTLRAKTAGLNSEQLNQTLAPSTMTLGGMLKHLALCEDSWFSGRLLGNEDADYWQGVDWEADVDWDWHSAVDDTPEQIRTLFDDAIAASNAILDRVIPEHGLDLLSVRLDRRTGEKFSLRWILLHMVEEYARHNGHADLLRESIDGATGE
ncbi:MULTISPECIES: DinB family protein [unclassified Nocardioides]|uniref:DinB family protein n=1 Tax=unclassified Nocardioides TaxID=2615069 RepID=UPI0006F991E5|nr:MULTISPECIES: DinB family protein [unclassified Nocardioides]KQY64709.1 mini-circle protein [Nocardioides sp. Root140]KQZ67311.1 mini-circle protein [Nocardioides sp. Root151]KRF12611.1 mini-circle protein [Nocardioides sp. Soil796]